MAGQLAKKTKKNIFAEIFGHSTCRVPVIQTPHRFLRQFGLDLWDCGGFFCIYPVSIKQSSLPNSIFSRYP
ncbi:UNVERIFIED_CONTAM: hypothetical protein PYX00_009762 [Menopon gallinae]|uniref:Uncharacterized protein n=1 Tax=Menopon gallinae TaxID=328185 RepID=A0AAW2HCQ5_9NEOP